MAQAPNTDATQMMRVRYPDDGPVEELRGGYFDVPKTVADKRGWLESQWREELARTVAAEERTAREEKVLADRIEQQRRLGEQLPSRVDQLEQENATLRSEIDELKATLAGLDEARLLEVNQRTADLMARSYDMGEKVMAQTEQTRQLQDTNAEAINRWSELRQQTLAVETNRLDFWNKAQQAAGEQIQQREEQIRLEQEHSRGLSEQIGQNWEIVDAARKLNATSVKKQNEAFKAAVTKTQNQLTEEFVEMLNLGLTALGLTEADLNMAAQQVEMDPRRAVQLDITKIRYFAEVMRKSRDVVSTAEAG